MKIIDFNNDLTIALNRVCFSLDFKMFFTSRHSLCPNGLTIGVKGKSKEDYQLFLTIRHYGYDHSHNNGISEFSDAYDFYPERIDFTEEHLNTVIEYFKTQKLEFYAEYMAGVPFFKSDRDG